MTSRDRTLAIALLVLLVVGGGGFAAYTLGYEPWQEKKAAAAKLQREIDDLDLKVMSMNKERKNVIQVKRASLPPDINVAKQQYVFLLERLLQQAKITNYTIPEAQEVKNARPPVTPEMAPKKSAYTTLKFNVKIKNANIWQVVDFLDGYYQLDLLHQITDLSIKRENKPNESRNGLNVDISIEAIILDGAEPRSSLFPVTTAIAAISGMPGLQAVALNSDLTRKLTSSSAAPILASSQRDYSLIARKDMFYGTLPNAPPVPFAIGKLRDVVIPNPPPTEPTTVRVSLSGDGSVGATVTARAAGGLLNEGKLEVDPKTHAISLPAVTMSEDLDQTATSTVTVEAKSADGQTTKKESFKVSLARGRVIAQAKDDISSVIKLVGVTGNNLGTITATIFDAANPFRYKVEINAKGVTVTKEYLKAKDRWGKDPDYEHPSGVLAISDEDVSATNRLFRVIAIDDRSLILVDIGKPESNDAKKEQKGFGRPRPGFGPRGGAARQGHADPLAVVTGNMATSLPPPKLYRWVNGTSLADLVVIPAAEAKKILKQATADGPLGVMAMSGN